MSPVIGITACRKLTDYLESVRRAGGEPQVVELTATPRTALSSLDGLLLTGGRDVDPARYGQEAHATFEAAEEGRDDFEIALIEGALSRDVPILAVCRGAQILNVSRGGTLVQDIPSMVSGHVDHLVESPPFAIAHEVWISNGSRLAALMRDTLEGADTCGVNSRHHQAVDHSAAGFRVTATAPDGVVEAIELPDARFCLGVQWHPENFWRTGEFRSIFEGFVDACRQTRA
jgi:putative glutamine amidotransferase